MYSNNYDAIVYLAFKSTSLWSIQSCVAYEWMVNHLKKGPKQGTLPCELSKCGPTKQSGHKENETTSMYCLIIHI
jgi:hypothetical protein